MWNEVDWCGWPIKTSSRLRISWARILLISWPSISSFNGLESRWSHGLESCCSHSLESCWSHSLEVLISWPWSLDLMALNLVDPMALNLVDLMAEFCWSHGLGSCWSACRLNDSRKISWQDCNPPINNYNLKNLSTTLPRISRLNFAYCLSSVVAQNHRTMVDSCSHV